MSSSILTAPRGKIADLGRLLPEHDYTLGSSHAYGVNQDLFDPHALRISETLDVLGSLRISYPNRLDNHWDSRQDLQARASKLTLGGTPITLTYVGFPFKSANPDIVLGSHPDQAERLAAQTLSRMVNKINEVYPGGCKLIVATPGLPMVCDALMVKEGNVADYASRLKKLLEANPSIKLVGLEDLVHEGKSVDEKRKCFEQECLPSRESCSQIIAENPEQTMRFACMKQSVLTDYVPLWQKYALARGEDALSNRELTRKAAEVTLDLIRTQIGFEKLVGDTFAPTIKLTAHPSSNTNIDSIGIGLIEGERFLGSLPWESCMVHKKDGTYCSMRRSEAIKAGYELCYDEEGLPSHYSEK